jgi:hypothetical protein
MRRNKSPDADPFLVPSARNRTPKITFSKNGTILFNEPASKLLNLEKGTRISFALEDEEPRDWFVFIDPDNGFELHLGSDNKTIFFSHRRLKEEFFKSHHALKAITYKFQIDEDPITTIESGTKFWRIIVDVT